MEIQKQAQLQTGEAQIRKHLSAMHVRSSLGRLELQQYAIFDNEIGAIADTQRPALVAGKQRNIALEVDPSRLELERQGGCVSTFEQAGSQMLLDFDGGADHRGGHFVFAKPLRFLRVFCVFCVRTLGGSHSSPSSTSSLARSSARAFASVSFHSSSGTESATMPAAAWTYSVWSLTMPVRIAMARSMSPA